MSILDREVPSASSIHRLACTIGTVSAIFDSPSKHVILCCGGVQFGIRRGGKLNIVKEVEFGSVIVQGTIFAIRKIFRKMGGYTNSYVQTEKSNSLGSKLQRSDWDWGGRL